MSDIQKNVAVLPFWLDEGAKQKYSITAPGKSGQNLRLLVVESSEGPVQNKALKALDGLPTAGQVLASQQTGKVPELGSIVS